MEIRGRDFIVISKLYVIFDKYVFLKIHATEFL